MNLASLRKEQGVAIITIDNPPVNTLSLGVRTTLQRILADVAADASVKAVVVLCAGKTFVSGADLAEFNAPIQSPLHRDVLSFLESTGKPCVAAMHGSIMGAGVELAAACHYRLALAGSTFGMPEVTLGIVPGAGGTQRLPRLMGPRNALDLLISGQSISAAEARDRGLLDEIVPSDLRQQAIAAAIRLMDAPISRTRDRHVGEIDSAAISSAREMAANRHPRRLVPELLIKTVEASTLPFDVGLRVETELSDRSLAQPESKALRHLFFAERETSRIPGIDPAGSLRPVTRAGIIGSGTMGSGIAMAFLDAGMPVTLLDVSQQAIAKGVERIQANYASSVKRGRLTEGQVAERLALLESTIDFTHLAPADLVIEAAPENLVLKREIFRKLDGVVKPGAVLATNTSTLDINVIASETTRPADVIGMHFFSPANVMRLLEIVRAEKTADDVIRTAFATARRLKKIGVLSQVCYGFIGNRMMEPYQREAEKMLLEGASPQQIDGALEQFGMAMGILAVHDMAGIDVGEFTRREREPKPPGSEREFRGSALLFQKGWLGQKSKRGFYAYSGRDRQPNPEVEAMFRQEARELGINSRSHTTEDIQQRCLLALVNEGARILEEGIALRASDIDVVYTAGYGFPRERGGPMFWADTVGLPVILEQMSMLRAQFGPQYWTPSPLLERLAISDGRFID